MAELPIHEEMAKRVAEMALDNFKYQGKTIREWIKIIAEQELCKDTISRQEVIDTIFAECSGEKLDIDFAKVLLLRRAIKALPPVICGMQQWKELKETIIELRDNDGTFTQQEVCKFLVNYMNVLEKQMEEENEVNECK